MQIKEANCSSRASPTAEDMATWSTLADIMSWVGLLGDSTDESTPEWSLMDALGTSAETPIREVGMIEASDYNEGLAEWTYQGRKPALLLRSKAKSLGHFARVFVGVEYTKEETLAYEAKKEAHSRAVALAKPLLHLQSSRPRPRRCPLEAGRQGSKTCATRPGRVRSRLWTFRLMRHAWPATSR